MGIELADDHYDTSMEDLAQDVLQGHPQEPPLTEIEATQRIVLERNSFGWKAVVEYRDCADKRVFTGTNLALLLSDPRQPFVYSFLEGSMVPNEFSDLLHSKTVGITVVGTTPDDYHDALETKRTTIDEVLDDKQAGFVLCWHATTPKVK